MKTFIVALKQPLWFEEEAEDAYEVVLRIGMGEITFSEDDFTAEEKK